MNSAKEKAKDLVDKFNSIDAFVIDAKQCALIAIDELTEGIRSYDVFLHHESAKDFMKLNATIETNLLSYLNYLEEVKSEIEKL